MQQARDRHQDVEKGFPQGARREKITLTPQVMHDLPIGDLPGRYFFINKSSGDVPAATASLNQAG